MKIDLTINQQINNWVVISDPIKGKRIYYICKCNMCQKKYKILKQNLLNQTSKICRKCSILQRSLNQDKVISEIKVLTNKLDHFPLPKEMKIYSPKLYNQMVKCGGINKFREILGYKTIKKGQNYWQDFNILKNHLYKNFKELLDKGFFPTHKMLRSVSLSKVVQTHGGSKKVAKILGCKVNECFITSDGHYVNSGNEYLLDEFLYHHGIQHEVNGKISNLTNHRYDFKIKDYYIEIWGFEDSRQERCIAYQKKRKLKENIYKKLDLKLISIEKEIFSKPIDYINNYFETLFKSLGFNLNNINKKFDIQNASKGCRYWNDEKIINELKNIITDIETFPGWTYLLAAKRHDLINALRRNGGATKFRKILNYPLNKKPNGYWNEINNVIIEIKNHIKLYKKFPSYKDLYKIRKHSLANAIVKHGGTTLLKKIILEPNASI